MEQPRNSKPSPARWDMDKVRYHLPKPPPPSREIRHIEDVLKDVVDSLEQPKSDSVRVLSDAWPKLVGPQISKHSRPGFIKNFSLYVFIDLPGWMPELERIKHILLKKLKAEYGNLNIRKLSFLLEHK